MKQYKQPRAATQVMECQPSIQEAGVNTWYHRNQGGGAHLQSSTWKVEAKGSGQCHDWSLPVSRQPVIHGLLAQYKTEKFM